MNIKPTVSSVCFCLKIPTVSQLKEVWSPEFVLQGVPWNFCITKKLCDDKPLLGIYLYCQKEDELANWSYAASASFKLLTFDDYRTDFEEPMNPFVFDQIESGFGRSSFITWKDLLDEEKGYVKNDTVNFELKIDVADPLEEVKSKLIFVRQSTTKFRMMVTNISNLMAARSPPFIFQKIPFNLVVYKSHCSHLGVFLYQRGALSASPITVRMSAKLISLNDVMSIEKIHTNTIKEQGTLYIEQLISWDALIESCFVDDNSIIIEVELM